MGRHAQARRRGRRQGHPEALQIAIDDFDPANSALWFSGKRAGANLRVEWELVRDPGGREAGVTLFTDPASPAAPVYPVGNIVEGSVRVREELGQHVSVWSDWFSGGV
jgi:hypothetical protein